MASLSLYVVHKLRIGSLAKDAYNFNRARFIIGKILPYVIFRSIERRS
jgi:hypothetical protein